MIKYPCMGAYLRHYGKINLLTLQISIRLYLESQLNLFSRMCWGNNAKVIHALGKELITFEETLLCAKNSDLQPSLRSKYVKLMMGKSMISLLATFLLLLFNYQNYNYLLISDVC